MEYRVLGRTGLEISIIGMGCEGMVPETVREHYAVLPHKAGECIQCGACEARCPFHVSIRQNMKRAAEVFGA